MSKRKILFLDRDGTLIHEPRDKQIDTLEKLQLEPGVIPALLSLKEKGYQLVMVSNQDGLGSIGYPQHCFDKVQEKLLNLFSTQGIHFDAVHICPHWESDQCECRKPRLGLVLDYLSELNREQSYVIGDRESDWQLAKRMKINGLLYQKNWPKLASNILAKPRCASFCRQTKETLIEVAVNLDQQNPIVIKTGHGFFDHLLEQFAQHAAIGMQLKACGDLHIDEHHLIEDTALALGRVLRMALGDKLGINRYGFLLPMDEAISEIALDLSGRPYCVFVGQFRREQVGGFPTEMIPHFFQSFANELKATIHLKTQGKNAHHQIESLFKSLGRAFRQAKAINGNQIPSTKGVL